MACVQREGQPDAGRCTYCPRKAVANRVDTVDVGARGNQTLFRSQRERGASRGVDVPG